MRAFAAPFARLPAAVIAALLAACATLDATASAPAAIPANRSAPDASTDAREPAPGDAARPASFRTSVVRLEATMVPGARTAGSLGTRRTGTGVILDERLVLTIGYLVLEAEAVEVTTASGRRLPATVIAHDHATGFGLVRTVLPMDGRPLALGDSDRLDERQRVLTIGQGEAAATELVVVSRRPFSGAWEYLLERPIYTFPPVNNWSGSALIALDGRLVGIGSLIVDDALGDGDSVPGNLFVPVNLLKPILDDLIAKGRRSGPVQPWFGIGTTTFHGNLVVTQVAKDGPAERAGFMPGDIVVAVGGERVADQAEFYRRAWRLGPAGTEVVFKVLRRGELREQRLRSVDRADVLRRPTGL